MYEVCQGAQTEGSSSEAAPGQGDVYRFRERPHRRESGQVLALATSRREHNPWSVLPGRSAIEEGPIDVLQNLV
jgi:hypothetical protein